MARRTTTYAIRLAVEGGGQVKAELVSVGQSGEQSLKRIESAGDRASGGLKGLGRQAELLRTGIRTLGGALITITSSVSIVNDTTWSTLVVTWRPAPTARRPRRTPAPRSASTAGTGASQPRKTFNGDIALIACFASSWTPAMVRRWHADPSGLLRPWNELPALIGSPPPTTPPRPAPASSPS
jgi:hypothetical protein